MTSKLLMLTNLFILIIVGAGLEASTIQFSGQVKKTTVFVDTPESLDTTTSTTNVLVPRAEITLETNSGPMVIWFCADIGFGPPEAPTAVGAMDIEIFIDGDLAKPGTTLMAQNIAPQNKCILFSENVIKGKHTIQVYWRSLGGEQMSMGFRTITVLHP